MELTGEKILSCSCSSLMFGFRLSPAIEFKLISHRFSAIARLTSGHSSNRASSAITLQPISFHSCSKKEAMRRIPSIHDIIPLPSWKWGLSGDAGPFPLPNRRAKKRAPVPFTGSTVEWKKVDSFRLIFLLNPSHYLHRSYSGLPTHTYT